MFCMGVVITLIIALAIGVLVGRRNARAGIDLEGYNSFDGSQHGVVRPRTLRDFVGVERWGELLPLSLYIGLVVAVLVLTVFAFLIWNSAARVIFVVLGAQGDQLSLLSQVAILALGIALFAVFTVAQRALYVARRKGRLWQRFGAFVGILGAIIAVGWLIPVVLL